MQPAVWLGLFFGLSCSLVWPILRLVLSFCLVHSLAWPTAQLSVCPRRLAHRSALGISRTSRMALFCPPVSVYRLKNAVASAPPLPSRFQLRFRWAFGASPRAGDAADAAPLAHVRAPSCPSAARSFRLGLSLDAALARSPLFVRGARLYSLRSQRSDDANELPLPPSPFPLLLSFFPTLFFPRLASALLRPSAPVLCRVLNPPEPPPPTRSPQPAHRSRLAVPACAFISTAPHLAPASFRSVVRPASLARASCPAHRPVLAAPDVPASPLCAPSLGDGEKKRERAHVSHRRNATQRKER